MAESPILLIGGAAATLLKVIFLCIINTSENEEYIYLLFEFFPVVASNMSWLPHYAD